jgi:hypothetical protein
VETLSLYREAVVTFVGLASLVIGATVATWERMTDNWLFGEDGIYDIGHHDTSIFLLIVGLALSAIGGMVADEVVNKY